MRHEFSSSTKRTLAARAGHRCSICEESTSAPAGDPSKSISGGQAAHITAASRSGPRYDSTLTEIARRSYDNGIWVCHKHAHFIDQDASSYSAAALRGYKTRRECAAASELDSCHRRGDRTITVAEFPHTSSPHALFEMLYPHRCDFRLTWALRGLLVNAPRADRSLDLGIRLLIDVWDSHPEVAATLSTLVSVSLVHWHPSAREVRQLNRLCRMALESDNFTMEPIIEPLAFALATKGHWETHVATMTRVIGSERWRAEDALRIESYYGGIGFQVSALLRHWRDPLRTGILKSNDAARILGVLRSGEHATMAAETRRTLIWLARQQGAILRAVGASGPSRLIAEYVASLKSA